MNRPPSRAGDNPRHDFSFTAPWLELIWPAGRLLTVITPADTLPTASLRHDRRPFEGPSSAPAGWLGSLRYGTSSSPGVSPLQATVDAPLLNEIGWTDLWACAEQAVTGQTGRVHWRRAGPWLFGMLQIEEAGYSVGLARLTELAYGEVFSTLDSLGGWHPLRIWNYLPLINEGQEGLERYRHFNVGRQQAFQTHRRDNLAGSPAACAIGTHAGPVCIYFLAGQTPSVPLENPRQVPAYHYPCEFGPRSPTFSRACLVAAQADQCLLLVSGTASIVGHESVHPGDVVAQTHETLRNLQAVIDAAHARCTARFQLTELHCTAYVRRAGDAALVRSALASVLGEQASALRHLVMLEADVCRAELLVEIEAHATAPGVLI